MFNRFRKSKRDALDLDEKNSEFVFDSENSPNVTIGSIVDLESKIIQNSLDNGIQVITYYRLVLNADFERVVQKRIYDRENAMGTTGYDSKDIGQPEIYNNTNPSHKNIIYNGGVLLIEES